MEIDAMAIRKQTIHQPKNDCYVGFVNYGEGGPIPDDPETLATEAHLFLLVRTRSRWLLLNRQNCSDDPDTIN